MDRRTTRNSEKTDENFSSSTERNHMNTKKPCWCQLLELPVHTWQKSWWVKVYNGCRVTTKRDFCYRLVKFFESFVFFTNLKRKRTWYNWVSSLWRRKWWDKFLVWATKKNSMCCLSAKAERPHHVITLPIMWPGSCQEGPSSWPPPPPNCIYK